MLGNNALILAASGSTPKSGGFNPTSLIFFALIAVAIYLLMIRPQRRRQQNAARQQNSVRPGAVVRTTAGMYATVTEVDGDDVVLEVAPGVHVKYMKRAVMDVVTSAEESTEGAFASAEAEAAEAEAAEVVDVEDVAAEGGADADAESGVAETAYEQATGTKKD